MSEPLESFPAYGPIPELGVEVGDWVDIELTSHHPVSVVTPHGPEALVVLRAHLLRQGREHMQLVR